MIKRFFVHILFLSVVFPVCLSASGIDDNETSVLGFEPRLSGELYDFFLRADGSYYLHNTWLEGDVLLVSGKKARGERLKYNIFLDELIWLSSKTYQPVKLDKKLIKEFYIALPNQRERMVFSNITFETAYSSEKKNIYAHKLYEGNISLMAHRRVIRTGERLASHRGTQISVPRLEQNPVFYIITEDNIAYEVGRFSRRALYSIFPEHRSEIRAAFRRERLRIRSENDMVRAVKMIDEMLSE